MNGGKVLTKGGLFGLLKNPIYIAKIAFKGQIYEGEHEAIVETAAWERVQQTLQQNGRNGGAEVRNSYSHLLKGLLRCASCDGAMIRTYGDPRFTAPSPLRLRAAAEGPGQLRNQSGI